MRIDKDKEKLNPQKKEVASSDATADATKTPTASADKTSVAQTPPKSKGGGSNKNRRGIYWSFMVWEDSAPSDYIEVLKSFQVSFCLSPWHDKDLWTKQDEQENPKHVAGTLKKKHRHGIFKFESMKSYSQVKELTDALNTTIPFRTISVSKSVQYFTHKNDKDKAQYDLNDIFDYGFGVGDYYISPPTKAEKAQYTREICAWMDDTDTYRMNDVIKEAFDNHPDTWARMFEDSPRWTTKEYALGRWQAKEAKKNERAQKNKYEPLPNGTIAKIQREQEKAALMAQTQANLARLDQIKAEETKEVKNV